MIWKLWSAGNWDGDEIYFIVNGEQIDAIKNEFEFFEYCRPVELLDVQNDEFQLKSTGPDGVCITSLNVNGTELLVGKLNDQPSFWIDGNQNHCRDDSMSTPEITIKNGKVQSSECKKQWWLWKLYKFNQNWYNLQMKYWQNPYSLHTLYDTRQSLLPQRL